MDFLINHYMLGCEMISHLLAYFRIFWIFWSETPDKVAFNKKERHYFDQKCPHSVFRNLLDPRTLDTGFS